MFDELNSWVTNLKISQKVVLIFFLFYLAVIMFFSFTEINNDFSEAIGLRNPCPMDDSGADGHHGIDLENYVPDRSSGHSPNFSGIILYIVFGAIIFGLMTWILGGNPEKGERNV